MESAAKKTIKQLDKLHEDWRHTALGMYDEGASDREVMRAIDLTPGSWEVLINDTLDSDFKELVTLGRLLSHAWWESQGRKNLNNPKFNTALWKANMSNRFGWTDKSEQSLTNIDYRNMDDHTLKKEIHELSEQLAKGRGNVPL